MCNGVRKPISPGLKNLGGREREGDKRAPKSFPRPPFFFFFFFFFVQVHAFRLPPFFIQSIK